MRILLGLVAGAAITSATPIVPAIAPAVTTFNFTGTFETYVAPNTGLYEILAFGAQGANGFISGGGLGAVIGGDFTLTAGETLQIAVGGTGGFPSGGGGGSFVVAPGNVPLVIAGGGGGGALFTPPNGGQIGTAGANGVDGGAGGTNGAGGDRAIEIPGAGSGGGGFFTAGGSVFTSHFAGSPPTQSGGGSFFDGLTGGTFGGQANYGPGGFGGGGAGFNNGVLGGGGGGGGNVGGPGGGGGSYQSGILVAEVAGLNAGNGRVVITDFSPTAVAAPEPGSLLLCGIGLLCLLGGAGWRRSG